MCVTGLGLFINGLYWFSIFIVYLCLGVWNLKYFGESWVPVKMWLIFVFVYSFLTRHIIMTQKNELITSFLYVVILWNKILYNRQLNSVWQVEKYVSQMLKITELLPWKYSKAHISNNVLMLNRKLCISSYHTLLVCEAGPTRLYRVSLDPCIILTNLSWAIKKNKQHLR